MAFDFFYRPRAKGHAKLGLAVPLSKSLVLPGRPWLTALLGGITALSLSCHWNPASSVRPSAAKARDQFGTPRCVLKGHSSLLLVDLSDSARAELEAATERGVVVVSYDCTTLRVLPGCTLPGRYAFATVTPKQHQLHLADVDDLRANAVLSQASSLEGALRRGSTLDVEWVQVGLLESSIGGVQMDELEGACKEATHVLSRVSLGAFSIRTRTSADVSARGAALGSEGNYDSRSERHEAYTDGDIGSCRAGENPAGARPKTCSALVQAELLGVGEPKPRSVVTASQGSLGSAVLASRIAIAPSCPMGYAAHASGCERERKGKSRHCDPKDRLDCTRQCDAGDADSCEHLAKLLLQTQASTSTEVQAVSLRRRGCDGGSQLACFGLGTMYERGRGVTASSDVARSLYQTTCQAGEFEACTQLGLLEYQILGQKELATEAKEAVMLHFERGCIGGDALGCFYLGALHGYLAKEPDLELASLGYARACRAGLGVGCTNWAVISAEALRQGRVKEATPASDILVAGCRLGERTACLFGACLAEQPAQSEDQWRRAWDFLDEGCEAGHADCCGEAGRLLSQKGGSSLEAKAHAYLSQACKGSDVTSCLELAERSLKTSTDPKTVTERLTQLDSSCKMDRFGAACLRLGELYDSGVATVADPVRAVTYYAESCERNNEEGCRRLAAAYAQGSGVPKDSAKAVELLTRRCNLRAKEGPSCAELGRLLVEGQGGTSRISEGLSALEFACDRNQAEACTTLGTRELSRTDKSGGDRAALYYRKACLLGDKSACARHGELTGKLDPPRDPKILLGSAITGCLDREIEVFFE